MDQPNGAPSPAPSQPAPSQLPRASSPPTSPQATTSLLPRTSLADDGTTPRPRDARTIHLILSSLGVPAYQERVPLQLLDFAYRYTSGILSDAAHLASEGYVHNPSSKDEGGKSGGGKAQKDGDISVAALRLATSARQGYQFSARSLPKETLLEMAAERNRVKLPDVGRDVRFGVRLPHERFVMTGQGWKVPEEWEEVEKGSEGEGEDERMGGLDGTDERVGGGLVKGEDDDEMGDEDERDDGGEGDAAMVKEEDGRMDEG